ncbi:MAG: adenylate/guanylate cyclase domain-containing protein, partial [Acidimicrobiales bacterium]
MTFAPQVTAFAAEISAPPGLLGTTSPELRQVSVLFCDLVGFTPMSEHRDPEEMRQILSGYFELSRRIVAR